MPTPPQHEPATLGHSDESDGIEEYDNKLPVWWLTLTLGCAVWAAAYAIHYHFIAHRSEAGEYDAEMAEAQVRWPTPAVDAAALASADPEAGREIFQSTCVACHGANLEGGIGPKLTDAEWIHGGTLTDITNTITNGVPDKGMPTWGPVLGPQKVAEVAAFVHAQGGGQ